MFDIGLKRENMGKIFLSQTKRARALIFGMLHHLVDLYHFFEIMPLGPKMPPSRGHILYIGLYREKL